MCVLSIALSQDFLKVIPKAALGSHSHGNMKQSEIFGVAEPTLNVASVTPHQLKNGTASAMAWWLPGASFSVDTVLSAQHHRMCNKINAKLSTCGLVSSYLCKDQEATLGLNTTDPQVQSVRVCQDSFHANAVDTMPLRSQEP